MCFLCDFESVKNWYIKDQFIPFDYDVCINIINNTFQDSFYLNNIIYKYINSINLLTYCIDNENEPLKSIENNKDIEFL